MKQAVQLDSSLPEPLLLHIILHIILHKSVRVMALFWKPVHQRKVWMDIEIYSYMFFLIFHWIMRYEEIEKCVGELIRSRASNHIMWS